MGDLVEDLAEQIQAADNVQGKFITESLPGLAPDERKEFNRYLHYRLAGGASVKTLAGAYLGMVDDIMGEQLYFARHRRYRYSRLSEVESHVYADPEYMGRYMLGVAISLYLWPQHQEIRRFFRKTLPAKMDGDYLEVGPGHGMFFLHALRCGGFNRYIGVDISPTSVAATRALIESGAFGGFSGYELVVADFLDMRPPAAAACVAGEVLEHVEQPERFLRQFCQCITSDGFVFISTCINAPVIDHIHNFNSIEELERIIAAAGLAVGERLLLPHAGKTVKQCVEKKLPLGMAYALRKA
jgi:SAM-dependent methyltransferase